MDYKNRELARQIANVSLRIEPGTKVYLKYKSGDSIPLVKLIIEEISAKGGVVFPVKYDKELEDFLMSTHTTNSIDAIMQKSCFENGFFDVFISLGSNDDFVKTPKSNLDVLDELKRMKMSLETMKDGKQWLLLNYPSIVDSNNLGMSYEDYYRYAMDAMTYDFSDMLDSVESLRVMMNEAKMVRIVGDNVNLSFNKEGIPAVSLLGNVNLPDGEIYTSPIRTSANGFIRYNVPSPKNGLIFDDIYLEFKDGKVVDFDCRDHKEEFERIISIDDGSRYIGEFAFGFNPAVTRPMKDILYDEKLCGSFHIALGNAYKNAFNGNTSALHWDMIYLNKTNNHCEIYFDDELVCRNGLFVPEKIKKLNK